jgi:DNA-binding transcriptional regulator YiaG
VRAARLGFVIDEFAARQIILPARTDEELAGAEPVYPPPPPDQVRALRARLGLTQTQFARSFCFMLDRVQQYERGRRRPSGPASMFPRVIEADPEAIVRALLALHGP